MVQIANNDKCRFNTGIHMQIDSHIMIGIDNSIKKPKLSKKSGLIVSLEARLSTYTKTIRLTNCEM